MSVTGPNLVCVSNKSWCCIIQLQLIQPVDTSTSWLQSVCTFYCINNFSLFVWRVCVHFHWSSVVLTQMSKHKERGGIRGDVSHFLFSQVLNAERVTWSVWGPASEECPLLSSNWCVAEHIRVCIRLSVSLSVGLWPVVRITTQWYV